MDINWLKPYPVTHISAKFSLNKNTDLETQLSSLSITSRPDLHAKNICERKDWSSPGYFFCFLIAPQRQMKVSVAPSRSVKNFSAKLLAKDKT